MSEENICIGRHIHNSSREADECSQQMANGLRNKTISQLPGELVLGDAIKVMKSFRDKTIDLIVTDPPYGINYVSNHRRNMFKPIENDDGKYISLLENAAAEFKRILKPNGGLYMFTRFDVYPTFWNILLDHFDKISNTIIWVKNNTGMGDLEMTYAPKHEIIIFINLGRPLKYRHPDVLQHDRVSGSDSVHPTQKPVDLLATLIRNSSDEGDVVLDPFMGSGSTLVAAAKLKRRYIGVEIAKDYYNIAVRRVDEVNSQGCLDSVIQ